MAIVKGKSLEEVEHRTIYKGCSFYIEGTTTFYYNKFENCSFRTPFTIAYIQDSIFEDCNFSTGVSYVVDEYDNLPEIDQDYIWFPYSLCGVEGLTSIRIFRQSIMKIPHEIWKLKNLETLHIEECRLSVVPPGISELKKLRMLNLENNDIRVMPDLTGLDLKQLSLQDNPLTSIPKGLDSMENLEVLDLSFCNLDELSYDFTLMESLQHVMLYANPFDDEDEEEANRTMMVINNRRKERLDKMTDEIFKRKAKKG